MAEALALIGAMYGHEKQIRDDGLAGEDKRAYRQTHTRPVVETFRRWCRAQCHRPELLRRRVVLYTRFDVVTLAAVDLFAAIDLHRLHRLSIWDCLVVRAALNGNCTMLHTEDLSDGYVIDTLTVSNPFAVPSEN